MQRGVSLCASLFLLLITQGCDIKGANDPYAYAPKHSYTLWVPPDKAKKRLPDTGELTREEEDYHEFSKESPFTLAEIIDIALSKNPDTKQSWATARMSAAEYGQSLQDFFILAEGSGNYLRTRSAQVTGPVNSIIYETQYGGELELSYTILDFGQTRMTSEAALQSLYNADWSHNSTIQQTIQLVMTDYYNYLYQKELLFAKEQDVLNAQVSLNSTEEKFRQGLSDVSDIVQARTSYLSAKLAVVTQKQNLHNAYTELINDMGLPADSIFYFQDYPDKINFFELETLDKLTLKANLNRPDLLAAEAQLKSSEASYCAARLQKYPVITGQLDVGRTYYQKGYNDNYDFTAQVNLTFPIFQGFFIENTIKKTRAQVEEAKASLEQVKLTILQQVANYRSNVGYAKESIEYAKAYLESAEEDFKLNLKKYRAGTGTIVDVINAQAAVADARAQLAQAQNSWYTSIANLAYATGILIPPQKERKTPYIELIEKKDSSHEKPSL